MKRSIALLWLSSLVAQSFAAEPSAINVDFQPGPSGDACSVPYSGPGALADSGHDHWNAVEPPVDGYTSAWGSGGNFAFEDTFVSEPLLDSTGSPTPVTITVYRGVPLGTTFAVNPSNTWAYLHVAGDGKALMAEYLIAPGGGTNTVDINHLVPGERYAVYLYGAGDQNTHQTTFVIDGWSKTTSGVPHEEHTLTRGGDYVVFEGEAPAEGTLTVLYTGAGASRDGNFNGLQILGEFAVIPSPGNGPQPEKEEP